MSTGPPLMRSLISLISLLRMSSSVGAGGSGGLFGMGAMLTFLVGVGFMYEGISESFNGVVLGLRTISVEVVCGDLGRV